MAAKSAQESVSMDDDYAKSIHDDMAALREDLASLAESLKDAAAAQSSETYDQLGKAAARSKAKAKESMEASAQLIEERPFTSVLVAFGVGILLGILADRRS